MKRILLLGGTAGARQAAETLAARPGLAVVFSLAGRVAALAPAGATLRLGGFGGADGLLAYLRENAIDAVLDATHPFAARMSANAVAACASAGLPYARLERPAWTPGPGDDWRAVPDLAAAVAAPRAGERVFLALGRAGSAAFAARDDLWRAARAAEDGAPVPGIDWLEIGPPGDATADAALFSRLGIDRIVARNSGGRDGRGKLDAARALGLPVVMIARPPAPDARCFSTVEDAIAWTRRD